VPEFLKRVVGETAEYAAAFKPNMAYFEAMGIRGLEILEDLLGQMPKEVPVILDAKRSDIGETQKYYAPFLGYDTLEPFLDWEGKAIYVLAVTSNAGSADIMRQKVGDRFVFELVQDIAIRAKSEGRKTFAQKAKEWADKISAAYPV